ncbi:MAG TPA: carboxypeptidase regulatory-like domain-containing protein, partial [Pyrinomonadaceae bacterium]|nr:carboxypeptidase regulatory-like domain-containing protein [Pyrinomonadaceae bacterium]
TAFNFTVTKNGAAGFATAVQYQTFDGTATVANNDYVPTSGTLNFGPFETQKTITVLVNGDTTIEPNETFTVRLLGGTNALIADGEGQGLIVNDDPGATPTPTPIPTPTPTPPNRFEGDINRSAVGVGGTGDGDVNIADQLQYQKFLSGADCPTLNEQPRLDAGPLATKGDGLFGSTDGGAIDAYARHDVATDFDPNTPGWQATPVGGPATITNLGCTPSTASESDDVSSGTVVEPASASAARIVRVISRSGARNSDITVDIEMTAQGNEAGTQYGLHFDPAVLSISDVSGVNANPDVMLGAGAPVGTTLNVNADDVANGNIGIVENFSAAAITALPEGATRIARVRFRVLDGAASGTSRVEFDSSVINGVTSDANGMILSSNYEGGDVSVSASHGVTVSGRVTSSDGRGIRGATVTIVDGDGFARTVTTSSFGYYTFDDVAAATYTIAVSSRQYRYASRTIAAGDNMVDVDFTGLE